MVDWSLLPRDLLELIVGRFETSFDIVLFRSVCSSWRSVVPLPRNSRCLGNRSHQIPMFINYYYRGKNGDKYCTLKKIPIFLMTFKTPFGDDYLLAEMRERKTGKLMSMCSPLSGDDLIRPGRHKMLFNSLTCQIIPFGHYYQINLEERQTRARLVSWRLAPSWERFSERVEIIEIDSEDCRDFILLLTDIEADLRIFRSHDMSWAEISVPPHKCQDMLAFKGKFYVVDTSGWGNVYIIEPSLEVSKIPSVTGSTHKSFLANLVKSGEDLLLVQRFTPDEANEEDMYTWFKVFRLDEEGGMRKWVQINDLNNQVIFLGYFFGSRTNLCCSVQKLPGAKENCIVFFHSMGGTILMFDLKTRRTSNAFSECRGYMGAFGANLESLVSCGGVTMPNPATSIYDLLSKSN